MSRTVTNASTILATAAQSVTALGTGDLIINGISITAADSSSDSASVIAKNASAISTAAAINAKSDQTGVTAVVGDTQMAGVAMAAAATATNGNIQLNGVSIAISVTANDMATTRQTIVSAINLKSAETGVTAVDAGTDEGGITLKAEDGRNVILRNDANFTANQTGLNLATGASAHTIATGSVTLVSDNGKEIDIQSAATGNAADAGFTVGTYSGTATQVASNLVDSTMAMTAGNVYVNGVSVGPSYATSDNASYSGGGVAANDTRAFSAIAKAAAFNEVADQTGVRAIVNENIAKNTATQATGVSAVSGSINGVSITGFTTTANMSDDRQAFVRAINSIADQTGVSAIDTGEDGSANGGGIQLIAEDGRNIITNFTNSHVAGFQTGATTSVGEFTLVSDKEIVIERGKNTNLSYTGLNVGEYGGGEDGMAIKNIDISTVDGANKAITAIDNALERVNNVRADLGAVNNRLDFAVNNLSSISNNASAARSRIADTDFASETAKLSRSQVLMQASQAMLAQANSQPQQVMSLLR
ncbi:flagellin [Allochromatium warmingii]|uniref:Flagellin n=1 Tax=Allochromatium warmingii TaxID=61595 RepID=A0A1H3ISK2_ALLWA|nr:flagellin [Allochromatium warmingii]SDY30726.1 flagellin [Allochromatium warmingii]